MTNSELGKFSIVGDPSEEFTITIVTPEAGQISAEALVPRKTVATKGLWRSGLSLIGKTQTVSKVTLVSCRVRGVRGGPLEDTLVLLPRYVIYGLHLENLEEAAIESIELQPRFMGSWFGRTLTTTTPDLDTGAVTISHPGNQESSYKTRGGTLSVGRKVSSFELTFDHRAQSVKEMFWCRLDFEKPQHFGEALGIIATLESFFSFATIRDATSKRASIRISADAVGQVVDGCAS